MSVNVDTAAAAHDGLLLLLHGTYTPATGSRINWVVSDPSLVLGNPTLDTIQNVLIPNGALTADQDIVYFTHDSRNGIAIIKRQDNSPDNVYIDSLAVILPTSTSSSTQVHTWHYISDLKNILSAHPDVETRRQAAIAWYSANVVRKRGRSVRVLDPKTVTWEEQLADSSYHPLHNLPLFLNIFGPSFVTVYKYVLARNRVVVYIPPGALSNVQSQESNQLDDRPAESESAINNNTATDPPSSSSLLTRPCELASSLTHILSALCGGKDRPWAVGFLDTDSAHNALLDDSASGWIACTSDKQFILAHLSHIDLVVDFSPVFNLAASLLESELPSSFDGIQPPLLLVPSSSSSSSTAESTLQLRPTRFTLLDIQLWSDIQGVMKRIERAKQRALRHPGINGNGNPNRKGGRNGNLQGRSNISDSEDWDDGDFAVPGGWNLSNTNGNTLQEGSHDEGIAQETAADPPTLQPPPLPQKLHYTLDLITAFHRHVVSLSKNYATTASPCLHIEFDDLERLFLEGGRRRRGSLLNGVLLEPSAVYGFPTSNLVDWNMSTSSAAINGRNGNDNGVEGSVTDTGTTSSSKRPVSMQPERRSPTPTPSSFSKVIRSSSRSPQRSSLQKIRAGSRSRSSSPESEQRTTLAQDQTETPNNVHIHPTPSSPFQPPPYPYVFPKPYPRRPDTATSFSSIIHSSQFLTPEHSPILTARNSPVMNGSRDRTPKVAGMKRDEDDVEPLVLDIPESVVAPPVTVTPDVHSFVTGGKEEVILLKNGEGGGEMDHDNNDSSRNSVSFPSPSSIPAPSSPQLTFPTPKKPFSHKRSYSDDVSHNPPQQPPILAEVDSSSPSSLSLLKTETLLPTDSQLLEVEAELREQEARMLAPSPTPPGLASPVLGPRKVKGWSVPTSIFLGKREREKEKDKEESAADESSGDAGGGEKKEKEKDGIDRNLVLTPVEVLWERRREGSASPSKDTAASVPPPPPPTPLPSSTMATLPPYLFSPQPLPPGAAAPSPNVGQVITSIIDALRGAIALNGGTSPTPPDATNGAASGSATHAYDRDSPPLTPPPPLLSAYSGGGGNSSSSPARTPTPQSLSGRETPRGLPKIDEEEEEDGDGYDSSGGGGGKKRVSLVRQQPERHRPLLMQGHATDSGDAADAEGADDGETGSMASSTAAGSVSLNPTSGSLGVDNTNNNTTRSSPSPIPPSPGFLTTTTISTPASAASVLRSPSPHTFGPSPFPSPSPSPSPSAGVGVSSVSSPSPLKPKPKPLSNNSTPNSSPQKSIKSPVLKKNTAVKGHATSSSLSNPSPSPSPSSSSSLISNLTKSLSLKIRPRRLSLLTSSSGSLKKGGDVVVEETAKSEEVMNRTSRSVPSTIGSSTGSMTSPIGSGTGTTTSPTSNGTSPSTSFSSVNSGNIPIPIKPRVRARATTTTSSGLPSSPSSSLSSSSKEPVFNMVTTLMSAEDGNNIEEWNGRNSGIGTLALANEMRRAQEESLHHHHRNSGAVVGGEVEDDTHWSPMESAVQAQVTPPPPPPPGLSSSKLAPVPKKGILRIRRASLTALPPSEPRAVVAESSSPSNGRNSSMSTTSPSLKTPSPTALSSSSSPSPRDQKKSKSTPTLKPKSMFTELMPEDQSQGKEKEKEKEKEDTSSALSRVRKDSFGLIKKGKGLLSMNTSTPPPPVPSLPNPNPNPNVSGSTESTADAVELGPGPGPGSGSGAQSPLATVRSNTPDSARRKLRKRRKSLIEPLSLLTTTITPVEV